MFSITHMLKIHISTIRHIQYVLVQWIFYTNMYCKMFILIQNVVYSVHSHCAPDWPETSNIPCRTCIINFILSWLQLMSDYFIYRKEGLPIRGSLIGGGGKKIINVDRNVFKPLFYNKEILRWVWQLHFAGLIRLVCLKLHTDIYELSDYILTVTALGNHSPLFVEHQNYFDKQMNN